MSSVFMSDGTLLKIGSAASPIVYTTIPGVMNVTPPARVRKSTDVYVHDQSAPITKTGAYEAQEVTFELAWDPGNTYHDQLFTNQAAKTTTPFKIVLPTSPTTTFTFTALISGIEPQAADAEGTEPIKLNVTLKLSADYTLT